jgi:cellulose synthase/poly-beta-1,6-N-acetylglucosamine synthase-like glycosyltransferase
MHFPHSPQSNVATTPTISEQVKSYARWLTADARRNILSNYREEIRKYIDEALTPVRVSGREVSIFAPFCRKYSAQQTITRGQLCVLGLVGMAGILGLYMYHVEMVVVTIAAVTVLYFVDLFMSFLLSVRTLKMSAEEHIEDALVNALSGADWPMYTILCPLYREAEVVPQFVEAMSALDYPTEKLQILFLTEEDDNSTRQAIQGLHLPPHFTIVTVPPGEPRTKPRACNYGLLQATGNYVVIYDAEDIPDPLQLKKAVLAFANQGPETACVQAKLNFYNAEQNLLTRWFTAEYSLWFDLTLPGLQKLGVPLPLGGTSNHFRTHLLRSLGAWDAFNVTEDCDLGLRMASYGLKTAMLDSTTYEEANSRVKNWIRQRSRWIKGYMQTYLVYMRQPQEYLRKGRLREFFSLQLFVGGKTAVLFVNPFMWAFAALYILLRPIDVYHTLFPTPVLYMGTLCLIFGNFFYTYTHLIGCMKRGQFHLVKWTLLIPIYWAMASVAAFMALQQLIFKPHYWEKTQHGLHLRSSGSSMTVISVMEEPVPAQVTMPLPAYENRENLLSAPQGGQFELATPELSSQISLIAEQFELELIEKTVKLKARASRDLKPILPHSKEFPFEDDTLKLPVLQLVPGASSSGEFELGDETLELSAVQTDKYTSMQRALLISAVPTKALPTIPLPSVKRR